MFTKESLIKELSTKSKTTIGIENGMSRYQVYRLEKKLNITAEEYMPVYRNEKILRDMINEHGTPAEVARQLKVSKTIISQWCNNFGITVEHRRVHSLHEDFFEIIDTEHKSYWLGYLMADGSMDKTCTKLTLNLSVMDEHMLQILREDINTTSPIKYSNNNGFEYARVTINSLRMCKNLIYHGIVPKKSGKEILPDTVPSDLVKHFIRGYMDGDGSIVRYDRGDSAIRLDFAGMSYNIFYSIHNHLIAAGIINCPIIIKQENNSRCRHLNYHCKNALAILEYLYSDATIFLERKYNKYRNISPAT